ncbi:GTP-binding protein [Plantactinospora soyae]|uniref:Signal recognition particle receptor subunit beta n=1 Tax=Plantactinospora soyae TaxID=1544732 RepID=A0A927M4E5_9ACTN|nr:ATP/GTP-binding protein [Plantactinospora soyae]MBE1486590.1 signal recognition particle receptor subunit beta [Plantactinospora soyae]
MDSVPSDGYLPGSVTKSVKILVVGSFGVGKTTLIGAISEITPLRTEEILTQVSEGVDDLTGVAGKRTTTVAMDFGRITLNESLALYLFGTPGQRRFWDLWEGLASGAAGVLVLVDTRPGRLEASFEVFDQLELGTQMPFVVAVNHFPDTVRHSVDELRTALDLLPETPILDCDARDRASVLHALTTLVEYAVESAGGSAPAQNVPAPQEVVS